MLKIDGEELLLNKNKGVIGAWEYEKSFDRSLTNDLIRAVGDGSLESVNFDLMLHLRLIFIMSGQNTVRTFLNFINKVPADYDFTEDFEEVIMKANEFYLPTKTPSTEKKQQTENKN